MEGQRSLPITSPRDTEAVTALLVNYLVDANATDMIVLSKDGGFIAKSGAVTLESAIAISGRAAAIFSATSDLAKLIGEHEFTLTLHQGKEASIHISLVDADTLLAVIFDNRTPIGAVRFWARKISSSIVSALRGVSSAQQQDLPQHLGTGREDAEDSLF